MTPALHLGWIPLLGLIVILCVRSHAKRRLLPPGPRGIPLLGNVLGLPKDYEWLRWAKFKDIYGPISSICIMGQPIIILNSLQACEGLLVRRSTVYSGRPVLQFAGEMVGWSLQMILSPYNDRFRSMRKLVARHIGTNAAITKFRFVQELEMRYFLARVCENQDNFLEDIRLMIAAVSLKIAYGYTVERDGPDPLLTLIDTAAYEFYLATLPAAWAVDSFPFLRYLPSWMPGAGFKKVAERYRKTTMESTLQPLAFTQRCMAHGTEVSSFSSILLRSELDPSDAEVVPFAASSLFGGGTDTIAATISTFVLAMVLFPDVQRKAQEELDRVVGRHRLPNFDDRDHLPYLAAVYKELLRWHVIGPMGIPHYATADDWYEGYFIPKGSLLMSNLWQIANDASVYENPSDFLPERFLGADSPLDPHAFVFGFGRRECPGQIFAGTSLYIFMSASLATLNFEPTPEGAPAPEFLSGTVRQVHNRAISGHPKPFKCNIKPRSPDALQIIRAVYSEHPVEPASQLSAVY
ncbi:cytochrome P450 oxidoreductase [Gloeopeniophorella convolvens]|nr:cytochrome P450 oxidoreductase [Gloeopeniophorella convolvens]